ncbi:MAG TPA: S24 family peptidase [Leucothrix sp.]|nr:S24 family peptidase [Leucothrix sp.]
MKQAHEVKINLEDAFKQNMSDGDGCSAAEPFALRTIDDSMEPEFEAGCIIIIDPGNVARDGSFVFAVDNKAEYIFRQLRIKNERHFLVPLNDLYDTFEIQFNQIEGVITQRAGKRRTYHKHYD